MFGLGDDFVIGLMVFDCVVDEEDEVVYVFVVLFGFLMVEEFVYGCVNFG